MVYRGACFYFLSFIFPVLAYWVISSFVLPPTRLKSLLITEMAKYVKGEFDCHSVELTYWETWPLAGIAIIGEAIPPRLIRFSRRNRN